MRFSRYACFLAVSVLSAPAVLADDECQPHQWGRQAVGDFLCRDEETTGSDVSYYTCTEIAQRYFTTVDRFLEMNPTLDKDCETITPNTTYCVDGITRQLVSTDGKCGPFHDDAICAGTKKQCCNSETWTCGDTIEDCDIGVCYEGACRAFGYSLDGRCGAEFGGSQCGGKWGECCNKKGFCGSGQEFCETQNCQSGNCTWRFEPDTYLDLPWQVGTTPDGSCGGQKEHTCDVVFGNCCSKAGVCGSEPEHCGKGCQSQFGKCEKETPEIPEEPDLSSYHDYGCYTETVTGRALNASSNHNSTHMTPDFCAAYCLDEMKYNLFGVEFGRQCWCGNALNVGARPAASGCSTACSGDKTLICGGTSRLNMYGTSPEPPYYNYGCYTETPTGRALNASSNHNSTHMTLDFCAAYCLGEKKHSLFGVENGRQCWCGDSLKAGAAPAASGCNMACSGDKTLTCGGASRLNMYGKSPDPPYYDYGCYTEATTGRAIDASFNHNSTHMTLDFCAAYCLGEKKHTLFGVEYGRQCWCGDRLKAGAVPAAASGCNMACSGDKALTCGGNSRLNLYGTSQKLPVTTP